jgi:sulfate permease, SulP family
LTLSAGDPVNIKAITATVATLLLAILLHRFVRRHRLPGFDILAVLAIVSAGTYLAGWTIPGLDGRTAIGIASTVPSSLPHPHIPTVKLSWAWDLASESPIWSEASFSACRDRDLFRVPRATFRPARRRGYRVY